MYCVYFSEGDTGELARIHHNPLVFRKGHYILIVNHQMAPADSDDVFRYSSWAKLITSCKPVENPDRCEGNNIFCKVEGLMVGLPHSGHRHV